MSAKPVIFSATGTIQSYYVTIAGSYVIEAVGARSGVVTDPSNKGCRVSGMFYLKEGNTLKIVAGRPGPPGVAGSRGGDSLVWTGSSDLPQPIKLLLSASGGRSGAATQSEHPFEAPEAGGARAERPAATEGRFGSSGAAIDSLTADALATQWTSGSTSTSSRTSKRTVRVDRCGYNAGAFRTSAPAVQDGDGYVSITAVAVPATTVSPSNLSPGVSTPVGEPAAGVDTESQPPSQSMLPQVTPRPGSWAKLLRQTRPPGTK